MKKLLKSHKILSTNIYFHHHSSLVCLFLSLSITSSSSNIECKYGNNNYFKIGDIYHCKVISSLSITTPESAQIGVITGAHSTSKTNDDVHGLQIYGNTVELFPRGIEKFFKNLKAITLGSCKIKEIYQTDLKPFPKITYLYIPTSEIEVLEEGLFEFNTELQVLGVEGTKVTHIDPNIFDHLIKLDHFWFQQVPCADTKYIYSSRSAVEVAITNVKTRCINSEYSELDVKIKDLESEAKSLSSEKFKEKLANLEKTFKASKFFKFRPLKERFENLKSLKNDNSVIITTTASTTVSSNLKPNQNLEKCPATSNPENFTIDSLKNITVDLKSSKCGLKDDFAEIKDHIKMSQSTSIASLNEITSKINDIKSSNSQLLDSQNAALNDLKLTQNDIKNVISTSQSAIIDSLSNLTKNLKSSQEDTKILQYEIKGSVSDMESSLSGLKAFQNDVKVALIKLKTTQNEMKISIDEFKVGKSENFEGNSEDVGVKLGSLEGKMDYIEGQLLDFKAENAENLKNIQKEMTNKLHKMSTNFDEKIKGIENRLMKKFEEILEEKFGKILNEKFGTV